MNYLMLMLKCCKKLKKILCLYMKEYYVLHENNLILYIKGKNNVYKFYDG